jgi:nitroimidazol reductase NimA-like FMN-containing flavoprotein (pyridoxamine 5'-phosphate oxidase superfamily)
MTTYTGAWDREEVAAFLEATAVPLRLACHTSAGNLWMLSLWFRFREGRFQCATGADADVVRFLEADSRVAFEVSTNDPPYKGVRGRGTATLAPDADKTVLRALVERYLGDAETPPGPRLLAADREELTVTVDPDRIHSWDFTARMSG